MRRLAPAKFNRFLGVQGRRADGFHELELVTTVLEDVPELTDVLEGERSSSLRLEVVGPAAEGLAADESNLVLKALRLLEREVGRELPVEVRLEKRIPHGGGLGGGSSDAAAALRLGNELFELGLGLDALLGLARQLGSDVPLFLLGGTVLGLGRGERVFPLRSAPLPPMLIVHPGLYVSTPAVYRGLTEVGYPFPEPLGSLAEGQAPPWRNDLTGAAIWVCPPLADVRAALLEVDGDPLLCGSGGCWAARFPNPETRAEAAGALRLRNPSWGMWSL